MKKAFSQNGRRNIAVVVDLLSLSPSLCAITTPAGAGLPAAGNGRTRSGETALVVLRAFKTKDAQYLILDLREMEADRRVEMPLLCQ